MTMPYSDWVAQRSCTRKIAHPTRSDAWNAVWSLILGDLAIFGEIAPYACDVCGAWHIGHPQGAR